MEKAKKFIEDYTRRCINAIAQLGEGMWDIGEFEVVYQPWITPEDALSAVEIAKEEVIEQMMKDMPRWKHICSFYSYVGDQIFVEGNCLRWDNMIIPLCELKKLPKEGEK